MVFILYLLCIKEVNLCLKISKLGLNQSSYNFHSVEKYDLIK